MYPLQFHYMNEVTKYMHVIPCRLFIILCRSSFLSNIYVAHEYLLFEWLVSTQILMYFLHEP